MIVLVGASASGKTEVAKLLAAKYNIVKMITTTTRSMREGEVNGRDYFFLSKEEFEAKINQDFFVEHTMFNGNYYGSGKDQIADDRCVVIDPVGLMSYKKLNNKKIVSFYLDTDEDTRHYRMIMRGDDPEKIVSRLENDKKVFNKSVSDLVDFVIENNESTSLNELTDKIYKLYIDKLSK